MIFNMNGGQGTLLNFHVLGGVSTPANPKENTIFVKTDVEITSWVLSMDIPSHAETGMIWIPVTTLGSLKFNALKKNGVSVYLDSGRRVQQYVDGQWVSKSTLYYANGEWVQLSDDWDGYYFKNGDQYTEHTGGWIGSSDQNSDYEIGSTLYAWTGTGASNANTVMIQTKNKVDLTNVKTLYATCTHSGYTMYFIVRSEVAHWPYVETKVSMNSDGTFSYDVSSLTGSYYIYFSGEGGQDGGSSTHISAVWGV